MRSSKNGFTLVELMISVFLLGLIAIFLYDSISSLQKSNEILNKNIEKFSFSDKLTNLIYDDIFLSKDINITQKDNSILQLSTKNSIHDIDMPYVSWFVAKENDTLVRVESILPFNKKNEDNKNYYHFTRISTNCEKFKIMQSKKLDNILVYIKLKSKEPIIFEFGKPIRVKKDIHKTKRNSPHNSIGNPERSIGKKESL